MPKSKYDRAIDKLAKVIGAFGNDDADRDAVKRARESAYRAYNTDPSSDAQREASYQRMLEVFKGIEAAEQRARDIRALRREVEIERLKPEHNRREIRYVPGLGYVCANRIVSS